MRVAIVQADPSARANLADVVARRNEVPWTACSEAEANALYVRDLPDLLVLDLGHTTAEGVRLAARLSARLECDILLLSSGGEDPFEAMTAGVLDALRLTASADWEDCLLDRLAKISLILRPKRPSRRSPEPFPLICIGASSGGPEAIARLLRRLPANYSASLVILQHVAPPFVAGLAHYLSANCALPVLLAAAGERPRPGEVLLAGGGGRHLGMGRAGVLSRPKLLGPRPSIDHFMSCVARYWHGKALGVLLTGLGDDGARGMLALHRRGYPTLAQDEASSTVFGMPRSAIELGAADKVLDLDGIAEELLRQEYVAG